MRHLKAPNSAIQNRVKAVVIRLTVRQRKSSASRNAIQVTGLMSDQQLTVNKVQNRP